MPAAYTPLLEICIHHYLEEQLSHLYYKQTLSFYSFPRVLLPICKISPFYR